MAFELAAVTAFIAGLNVTGKSSTGAFKAVTINDWADFKEEVDTNLCPVFQPDITSQITVESFERDSFGSGSTAKQTLVYTIPYVLLFEPAVATRAYYEVFPNLVYTLGRVMSALIVNDTPTDLSVDLIISAVIFGQTVSDQNGNPFHGASVSVRVTEYVEPTPANVLILANDVLTLGA